MSRAIPIAVLLSPPQPRSLRTPIRVGAISLAYVARSSKAGKSALAEIEKFVKQKESEAAVKAAELEKQQPRCRRRASD